jgi:hypothetical protein
LTNWFYLIILYYELLNEVKKVSFKPGLLDSIEVQNPNYDVIAALLPSYLDRSGSGLIYMVDQLIKVRAKEGGFYNLQFDIF